MVRAIRNVNSFLMYFFLTDEKSRHASQGLAMQLVELPTEIPGVMSNDMAAAEGICASWIPFYQTAPYKQDDSGI